MPVGETIADYLRGRRAEKRTSRNDAWGKIQGAVNTGVDIWKTLNEQNKYKPGSDYMNAQELISKTWPQENATAQLDIDKQLIEFKNANPGLTAEQLTAKWLMTPEGKAYLQQGWDREDAKSKMEHQLRMDEIYAQKTGAISQRGWESYKNAIDQARNNFYQLDPGGNVILKKGVTAQQVKDFLYKFAAPPFADANDISGLKAAFDMWVQNPDFPSTNVPDPGTDQGGNPISPELGKYKTEQLAKYDVVGGLNKAKQLIASIKTPSILGKKVVVDPAGISEKAELELAFIANKMADNPEAQLIVTELAKKGTPTYQRLQQIAQTLERLWQAKSAPSSAPIMKGTGNPLLK